MNKQITAMETPLALHENFIGLPTEPDAAGRDVLVLKPTKRKLITTMALTIHTCRWPVGDPAESDFHYCGKVPLIGHPYCEKHDAQCHPGAARRKRGRREVAIRFC
jgi:GcrA cell cycle regulator